jgi:hypothetical protein
MIAARGAVFKTAASRVSRIVDVDGQAPAK